MRRGIIDKLKEKISKQKKLPDLIKVNITDEKLKEFKLNILKYEEEEIIFKINNKQLNYSTNIKSMNSFKLPDILNQDFMIKEVEILPGSIEGFDFDLNSASVIELSANINSGQIEEVNTAINEIICEDNLVEVSNGMDLLCSIPKKYYSTLALSKEKKHEIGLKIKKKYPELSFREYGIRYVFLSIPYKSIEKFSYNDKKGKLEVYYKKEFCKSEMINFVVLKNINDNTLKKIFI